MPPQQVVFSIIGIILVMIAAYYVTYFIGMKASGQSRSGMRNRNIVVRDRYSVARDKGFYVVEIAGKVYIVGFAGNGMTLLDTIDAEEFAAMTENDSSSPQVPWGDTPVGRYGNRLTKMVVSFVAARTGKGPKEEQKTTFEDSMKKAESGGEPGSEDD